jgi:hypothetical protein
MGDDLASDGSRIVIDSGPRGLRCISSNEQQVRWGQPGRQRPRATGYPAARHASPSVRPANCPAQPALEMAGLRPKRRGRAVRMGTKPSCRPVSGLPRAIPAVARELSLTRRLARIDHALPNRKRPPSFPDGLSCLTAAPHLTGDFRTFVPGAYLPADPDRVPLHIGAVAILLPDPSRWFPISVR